MFRLWHGTCSRMKDYPVNIWNKINIVFYAFPPVHTLPLFFYENMLYKRTTILKRQEMKISSTKPQTSSYFKDLDTQGLASYEKMGKNQMNQKELLDLRLVWNCSPTQSRPQPCPQPHGGSGLTERHAKHLAGFIGRSGLRSKSPCFYKP